ncbi:MAG: hypothetical protein CMH65_08990 [Nevskiales bacterium]|jgi:transcriptional regulator with XRE-family HTH domain|nr:hypothetical protein [Nevskiales bacterium]
MRYYVSACTWRFPLNEHSPYGSRIKRERERLGLTQKQLATLTGMSLPSVVNYESGRRVPSLSFVDFFCEAGASMSALLVRARSAVLPRPEASERVEIVKGFLDEVERSIERRLPNGMWAELFGTLYRLVSQHNLDADQLRGNDDAQDMVRLVTRAALTYDNDA